MSLKCQLCGKEIYYDRKVCHRCEETAVKSGLNAQDGKHNNKWRCDNFLELKSLAFGSKLTIPHLENLENIEYNWNNLRSISNDNIQMNERKINYFLKFE